jgi:glycosyltransferase involved in cell wall biosynthesis
MPVYNGANYIRRAVQSILAQDYEDFELIISDNASTDETESICREFAARDSRIYYARNDTNVGASRNYNKVFRLARGQFFKWAAHDDECYPTLLRRCVEVLERAPDQVVMVYPLAELIDKEGKVLISILDRIECRDPRPHRRLAHLLWYRGDCDAVFGLIKAEYLKKTRLIGPLFAADIVLLAELAMLGEIWELNEVLFRLRAHRGRSMRANGTPSARATWYDPAAARRLFIMPEWERMVWEMCRSAGRSSLPPAEKLRCCLVIPGMHYWRRFKKIGGRVKRQLKLLLGVAKDGGRGNTWTRFLRRVRRMVGGEQA